MIIVAVGMMVLGVVAIAMGFNFRYPNATTAGAVFFIGGWLMISLDRIAWTLEKIYRRLRQEKQEGQEEQK